MGTLAAEYLPIVLFLGVALALGGAFMAAAYILAPSSPDKESFQLMSVALTPLMILE